MAFKFIALFACITVASAGSIAQVALLAAVARVEEYDEYAHSTLTDTMCKTFSPETQRTLWKGSLNDADDYRRIVYYTADPINGFNAVVSRVPLVAAALAINEAAPFAYAAPAPALIKAAPAPLVTAGSAIVKISFASPVMSYAW